MDQVTDDTSPASDSSSQTFSQPSHLCQACLSVITRDDLVGGRYYPHHSSLDTFVQAALDGCYHCSQLLASININDREDIILLAKGKAPKEKTVKKRWDVAPITEWAEKYPDPVEREARFRELYRQTTSWVSFTMMGLIIPNLLWRTVAQLNPMYEEYIPPHLLAYRSSLVRLWGNVRGDWESKYKAPFIVPHRGV